MYQNLVLWASYWSPFSIFSLKNKKFNSLLPEKNYKKETYVRNSGHNALSTLIKQ